MALAQSLLLFVSVHMTIKGHSVLMAFTFGEGEMGWYPIMRTEASSPFCEEKEKNITSLHIHLMH